MELTHIEEKNGYSLWQNNANDTYIVIDGLDPNQVHTTGLIEGFMVEHYAFFAVVYWILLVLVFAYVTVKHLFLPIQKRVAGGGSLFLEE